VSELDPPGGAAGLVGRAGELAVVREFLDAAGRRGGALLLAGEPGIGKSALLDAAARMASTAGMALLRGSGVEAEADLGFSALNQLLLPLHARLPRLDEAHRDALSVALGLGTGPPPGRGAMTDATVALLRAVTVERPLLIILDDLQWVDRSSAGVLGMVARRLDGIPAGLLAAVRSGEESFFERSGLPQHEVPPLDDLAAAHLISTRFPMLATRVLRRLLAEARGNPLALLELPAALSGAQLAAQQTLPPVLPLGHRLQSVFASRVTALSPDARRLLLLAALEGTGDLDLLLAAAAAATGGDGWALLTDAQHLHLIHLDPARRRLAFRHPLVRSAVIGASTGSERQQAHQVLADVLLKHPERRARHLADAAASPDEAVASVLEQAAHRAQDRGDPTGAVSALLRAADLSPSARDRSRRLAQAAYLGAGVAGELRTAAHLLAEARRADPGQTGSLHAAATAALLLLNGDGDIGTAVRLLAGTIDSRGDRLDSADGEVVEALHHLFELCMFGARLELWEPFHVLLARLTPAVPPTLRLLVAMVADPVRTAAPVLADLQAAIDGLRQEEDPLQIRRITLAALVVDRMEGCRDAMWRVIRTALEGDAPAAALAPLMHMCLDDFFTGRWQEAALLAQEGVGISSRLGFRSAGWPFRANQAMLAAVRGDSDLTHAITDEIIGWATPRGANSLLLLCHYARNLAALGDGDFEQAYQHAGAISPAGRIPSHARNAPWVVMDLIEAAIRTGRHDEAAAHAAAIRQARVAAVSPRAELLATAGAALAASDDRAGELFERALAVAGAERWPFELARVRLVYGEHLRRARATSAARTHLGAAHAAFEHLGARPWATRAATELRAAGAGAHTTRATDARSAPALTSQEHEVASLAALGLTNQQIAQRLLISRRTVDVHLYRAFHKLGIRTRAALRDALDGPPGQAPDERRAHGS
jgi:DNA-binding CsgD family transcriptional regulator